MNLLSHTESTSSMICRNTESLTKDVVFQLKYSSCDEVERVYSNDPDKTGDINCSQTLSSHSSTPEFQRNVTPNGSQRLASGEPMLCTFLQKQVNIKRYYIYFYYKNIYND